MDEAQLQQARPKKAAFMLVALIILAVFGIMLNQNPWTGFSTREIQGTVGYQEQNWTLRQDGTLIADQLDLSEYLPLESGKLYTVSNRLTYDGNSDPMPYGFIHMDHMYCRVLLDGEVLFSFMPEDVQKWDASKSPGFVYKAFPVPSDCLGKTMEIQLLPSLTTAVDYGLPDLAFGDFTSSLHATVIRDTPHNIVTILCIFLGLTSILFSATTLSGSDYREGISIGVFSLLFALYLLTECMINAYFIGNPYYLYLLNYITFSLLPMSLMGFMRERLLEKHRKICTSIIRAEVLFFLVELVLHFGGVLDMREIVPVIHVIYFSEMLLVTLLILSMKDRKKKHSLVLQMVPVIIGICIDGLIYWLHWEIGINDATFTILGVIILLFIELLHIWRSSISMFTESARSSLYRQMAYIDELTGVGNRRSYDQEIDRIISGEKVFQSMIVASADVNRLKFVNDHFGHAAGDKLIRSAAQIMVELIGDRGKVFRTGGDEFAVFMYDVDLSQCERLLQAANQRIASFNCENEFPLGLAIGCVQIRDDKILDAVHEADQKMYANKALLKMTQDRVSGCVLQR